VRIRGLRLEAGTQRPSGGVIGASLQQMCGYSQMKRLSRWLQNLVMRPKKRIVRRRRRDRVLGAVVVQAYRRTPGGNHKRSHFANEAVEVPAYEDRALRGERAPHRFRWRGRWYRVVDVAALWHDGRKPKQQGRFYANVVALPGGVFQLYFEQGKRKDKGRWLMYRKVELRSA